MSTLRARCPHCGHHCTLSSFRPPPQLPQPPAGAELYNGACQCGGRFMVTFVKPPASATPPKVIVPSP